MSSSPTFVTIPPPPVVLSKTFNFAVSAGGNGAGTLPVAFLRDQRGLSISLNILGGTITAPSAGGNSIISAPLSPLLPTSVQPGGTRTMVIDVQRAAAVPEPAQITLSSGSVMTITRLGGAAFGASEVITLPNITVPYR